jgi:predicted nucleic acid-binding protein
VIVVDTSVWIDFFRGGGTWQVEHLAELIADDEPVALTDIVLTEILQGLPDDREVRLDDVRRAASLQRTARTRGITVRRTLGCLIASVGVRDDVPLLHADADFDHLATCSDLRVVPHA